MTILEANPTPDTKQKTGRTIGFLIFVCTFYPYQMKITRLFIIVLFLPILYSCESNYKKISLAGEAQGTYYAITYFDKNGRNYQPQIDSLLRAFDLSVSLWVDESVISRINRGDTTVVPDEVFIYNFNLSKQISQQSEGYFDFTIGPLASAWGFHRRNKLEMSNNQIDSLMALVDFNKVSLIDGKVVKEDPRMSFDFNAIAQGHSVDLIVEMLDSFGLQHFLVDVGGEIVARNTKPDGSYWQVGIESPASNRDDERDVDVIVSLKNKGLATSGSYRKYFEKDGLRYSHTISPKTGRPVDHNLLSVTVMADNAAEADAWATAFMVMGLEKSVEMIKKHSNLEAYFIFWTSEGTYGTFATEGMRKLIKN